MFGAEQTPISGDFIRQRAFFAIAVPLGDAQLTGVCGNASPVWGEVTGPECAG
jgi:hypothetical protein